jgi:hypothetical protein
MRASRTNLDSAERTAGRSSVRCPKLERAQRRAGLRVMRYPAQSARQCLYEAFAPASMAIGTTPLDPPRGTGNFDRPP